MVRHFLDVDDLSVAELHEVLDTAAALKAGEYDTAPLAGESLTMVFEKPSTRTRVSFETGMTSLGGHAVFLGPDDIGLHGREPIKDIARVLSRYGSATMVRLFDHADAEEMAAYATAPVINGLTDDAHPCQTLADLLTIRDLFGDFDAEVAWVGDGNNVAQSFAVGAAMVGLDLTVATPDGYELDDEVLNRAAEYEGTVTTTDDPGQAVADADVVYTDVWISMGEEDRREQKLSAFDGFQVNAELVGDDAVVMHCLPAHRGEEITDGVLESERSVVWRQAENRKHAQCGLLVELLG
ncbi:ornithine carbamoyltransferase [Salinirubrum litoreum]|uniref:Ornithine carbamoyltransferase n=1 Tax=Salinirubrum litoreum TaxID=1126234 RepID=A0ABD5RBL1_9EURY|nr:ornithine carbamoyltransferase [Salinirubrum litoreum]